MGRSQRKGLEGENGVLWHFEQWYPNNNDGEGIPFKRIRSKGAFDIGDVIGPFTCCEAKNYTKPNTGALLDNAEWKAGNAQLPYWFLCYKAKGYSAERANNWHTLMTVEELVNGFEVKTTHNGIELRGDKLIEQVPELCSGEFILEAEFVRPARGRSWPEYRWRPLLIFSSYRSKVPEIREGLWREYAHLFNFQDRVIPFIINYRKDVEGPHKWYVYTKLSGISWSLETLGVLPQLREEYVHTTNERESTE